MKIINRAQALWSHTKAQFKSEAKTNKILRHESSQSVAARLFRLRSGSNFYAIKTSDNCHNNIDIKKLSEFIHMYASDKSYEGLLATHLQQEMVDATALIDHKKNMAIQKMKALVLETILITKKIEINQIARSKG